MDTISRVPIGGVATPCGTRGAPEAPSVCIMSLVYLIRATCTHNTFLFALVLRSRFHWCARMFVCELPFV